MTTCVLFDLYGTLVDIQLDEDSVPLWAGLSGALAGSDGTATDPGALRTRFRSILAAEASRGREGFIMEAVFRRLMSPGATATRIAVIARLFRQLSLKELTLRSYVGPLFEALRGAASKIAIVSNTEASLTRFDLDQFPILLTADTIVLSSEVGVRKPDARIFHLTLGRLRAAAASGVFVGNDWVADVVGARAAGLRAIYLSAAGPVPAPGDDAIGVVRAAPTLASIVSALRVCGWRG